MKVYDINIDEIKPYAKNPRKNDDAVPYVKNSIEQFGFKVPIVIDTNSVIVAGHTRWKAAQELGMQKVPCIIADDLSAEQIKAFRLADNKVAEAAEWDFSLLGEEMGEIFDIDMEMFGFAADDITQDEPEPEREDLSENVEHTYEVIVECSDEEQQEAIFTRLQSEGMKCRVLTL